MEENQEFSINYWGKEFDYTNPQKKGKSNKSKLAIIALFLLVVIIVPSLALNLNKIKLPLKKSSTNPTKITSPVQGNKIASISDEISGTVGKNESYWKISKRYCGTGSYYLTIQEKNNFKALYEGDSVIVICR